MDLILKDVYHSRTTSKIEKLIIISLNVEKTTKTLPSDWKI